MTDRPQYWDRAVLVGGPTTRDLLTPTWLGSVQALRQVHDTLDRTMFWPQYWVIAEGTKLPNTDTWVPSLVVQFVAWWTPGPDNTPMDPNTSDPSIVAEAVLTPKYFPSTKTANGYMALWDTNGVPVQSKSMRTPLNVNTTLPHLNIGYQIGDPTGTLFNVANATLRIGQSCLTMANWLEGAP
jgi:hypothetical protein